MADGFQGVVFNGGEAYIPDVDMQTVPVTERPPESPRGAEGKDLMSFGEVAMVTAPFALVALGIGLAVGRKIVTAPVTRHF
jgi:hypothetical protein